MEYLIIGGCILTVSAFITWGLFILFRIRERINRPDKIEYYIEIDEKDNSHVL